MLAYSHILQGHEATEENAINTALGLDWAEVEIEENGTPYGHYDYIDFINGVAIYYNFVGDYYFFSSDD